MTSYLLDTHIFLWWYGEERRIPQHVREHLADPEQQLHVSSVSAMEAATKLRIGKLDEARTLVENWDEHVARINAELIDMTTVHGLTAGLFEWPHRDPFDRMLAAQAIIGNLTFVTADKVFRTLPGLDLLTW